MSSTPVTSATSTLGTLSLTGLGTGIDWQTMLSEMQTADEESLTPYTDQVSIYNTQLSAWQTLTSDLSSLQTASQTLSSPGGMDLFTANVSSSSSTSASALLSATASSSAAPATHQVVITNTAQSEILASSDFSSESSALNISGTILVNGQAVNIASTDTLQDIADNINSADSGATPSGVSASIVQDSPTTWRLELTSDSTGASGISLLDGSATDTLGALGFNGSGTSIANPVTGGAQSEAFSSSSTGVAALLGTSSLSGTVTINGTQVALDTTDSLTTIATDLTNAGIQASVVSSTSGSQTTYRLSIANMTSYTDQNNVLQSLGLVQGNRSDVVGVTGSVANTSDGSTPITASTDIANIFGYNYNAGDEIAISGTTHDGTAVASTDFAINSTTTVGDLLTQIQDLFGNVTASVTSSGAIQVVDNATGTSELSVNLTSAIGSNSGTLNFGSFGQAATISKRVLQQGTNAAFTVDGMSMTSASNTVTDAISGVTLNLLGADPNTTLTVSVGYDTTGIENEVSNMVNAYNGVMSYINSNMSYNTQTSQTGGPLFGNTALETIKSQLESTVLDQVGSGTFQYLSQIGITQAGNAQLSFNTTQFESALTTNFNNVADLFADSASTSDSQFQYLYDNSNTESGTYSINITQLSGTSENIAGTIDGLDATGQGNILTLDNAASGANGLAVSYTGTTVPAGATVTVNRGIASLLNGLVNAFSDPNNGTITDEQNGLQGDISQLNQQIDNMQSNITMQINNLQTEFLNMDTTVASLDSMQSYLSYQLNALTIY